MGCEHFIQVKYERAAGYTIVPICSKDGKRICIEGGLKCYGCPERSEEGGKTKF
mgnify:CR=1 FL=1